LVIENTVKSHLKKNFKLFRKIDPSQKKHIGDEITEELEYKPAVFFANQYIRPKYACPKCPDNGIAT
jgi:hypothetical protein